MPICVQAGKLTLARNACISLEECCRRKLPEGPIGEEGYKLQTKWWQHRRRLACFRFNDLPPELRTMVYKLVFQIHDKYWVVSTVPRMVNYRFLGCSCVYCRAGQGVPHQTIRLYTSIQEQGWIPSPPHDFLTGTHDTKDEVRHPLAVGSNLSIALALSASEQERAEMQRSSKNARDAARTSFSNPLELRKLFAWPQIALTYIGLNFSTFEYLKFFELPLHQPTFQYVQEMSRLVRTIPTLTKLDIKFRDPRWEIWGGYPHFLLRKAALICHRKVVSLILILAIPNLCHIEEVRIEGHATQNQCDLFYQTLHKYKTSAYDRAQHGHMIQRRLQESLRLTTNAEWRYIMSTHLSPKLRLIPCRLPKYTHTPLCHS
jgi:hypothetical protein